MQEPYEVLNGKFPSPSFLLPQIASRNCPTSAIAQFLTHYITFENLHCAPILEMDYCYKTIRLYKEADCELKDYYYLIDCFHKLLLCTQANGEDVIDWYKLFNESFSLAPDTQDENRILNKKIHFFAHLLEDLSTVKNPHENRSHYVADILSSAIKQLLQKKCIIENIGSINKQILTLMRCCIQLNMYQKHRDTLLHLVNQWLTLGSFYSENEDEIDAVSIFNMTKLLLNQKEYGAIKKLAHILISNKETNFRISDPLDADKDDNLFTGTITLKVLSGTEHLDFQKNKKLFGFFYAIKLLKKIPQELKTVCNITIYQKLQVPDPESLNDYTLKEWTQTLFHQLSQLHRAGNYVDLYFNAFIAHAIKNYSAQELINYFTPLFNLSNRPILHIQLTNPTQTEIFDKSQYILTKTNLFYYDQFTNTFQHIPLEPLDLEQVSRSIMTGNDEMLEQEDCTFLKKLGNHYSSFNYQRLIRLLLNQLNINEIKDLDLNTKINLLACYTSFEVLDLIANVDDLGRAQIIQAYTKIHYIEPNTRLVYANYPFEKTTIPIPYEANKPLPLSFHLYAITQQNTIPPSFGWGLLPMENNPTTLSFEAIEPLLMHRDAIILSNNELFYADLKLRKVRQIKHKADNKDFLNLQLAYTSSYQLADEKNCKLISSLTGRIPPFHAFYSRYQKANQYAINHSHEDHTLDYTLFMLNNVAKLSNIYQFMGEDLFLFMKKMIGSSPQKLNRYFENFDLIPLGYIPFLKEVQAKFKQEITTKADSIYDVLLIQICQLEDILSELNKKNDNSSNKSSKVANKLFTSIKNGASLNDLSQLLSKANGNSYIKLLELLPNSLIDFSVFEKNPFLLSRLLMGRKAMKENHLSEIFDKLIAIDISEGVQFTDFAYNANQSDVLGKKLSAHNIAIRKILSQSNIKDSAINYSEIIEFTIEPKTELDIATLANALYVDLVNINTILQKNTNANTTSTFFKASNSITCILNAIATIQIKVKKPSTQDTISIQNGSLDNHIKAIALHLKIALNEPIGNAIQEDGLHFLEHKKALFAARKSSTEKSSQKKEFLIKQWDKNQMETFILGDYLSCCLAPDSTQFPAIVQRRMDAAMMMHVIYDKALNEPVCGNWLFLGYDKANTKDIYVVANFFEIRTGYGLNKQLSKTMIDQLLAFTGQYAKDIGAKDLLLRPLTYGLIPDFEGQFSTKTLSIEKVGGFFDPSELNDKPEAISRYYLQALEIDTFYVYEVYEPKEESVLESGFLLNI